MPPSDKMILQPPEDALGKQSSIGLGGSVCAVSCVHIMNPPLYDLLANSSSLFPLSFMGSCLLITVPELSVKTGRVHVLILLYAL